MTRLISSETGLQLRKGIFEKISRHWFLCALLLVIPAGMAIGYSDAAMQVVGTLNRVPGSLLTAVILFLMSMTLDSGKLLAALRSPRAVVVAAVINQVVVPLMAIPLLPMVSSPDLRLGLLIASIVPCTMAAASVWTRMANGNDAVSLLVTLLTNVGCFLVIPAWLSVALSAQQLLQVSKALAFGPMVMRLVFSAVLPILCGQLIRLLPRIRQQIDRRKKVFSNSAQTLLLFIVYMSALTGGMQFSKDAQPPAAIVFVVVFVFCNGLHVMAMLICVLVARILRIRDEDRVAMIFASSQKTLPIGVAVAQASGVPLAIVPMLMFHASQLFVDTWVASKVALKP